MDKVKELIDKGEVTRDELINLAKCSECGDHPPTFDQLTKDQRSEAWLKAREGRVTASDCAAICVSAFLAWVWGWHVADLISG